MASMRSLVSSLPKFGHGGAAIARSGAWNPRIFAAARPRRIQVPPSSSNEDGSSLSSDGVKGRSETGSDEKQDKAYSTAPRDVTQKAKEAGREMSVKAENIGERAKQAMQDAWDSTKTTAQKASDTVLGKAQETADTIKQKVNNTNNNNNNF